MLYLVFVPNFCLKICNIVLLVLGGGSVYIKHHKFQRKEQRSQGEAESGEGLNHQFQQRYNSIPEQLIFL